MCLGQCEPFVMTGVAATSFDRSVLSDYDNELGNILQIEDVGNKIIVGFPDDMPERDKDNAHLILEVLGFE